jgi:hypothetical protein
MSSTTLTGKVTWNSWYKTLESLCELYCIWDRINPEKVSEAQPPDALPITSELKPEDRIYRMQIRKNEATIREWIHKTVNPQIWESVSDLGAAYKIVASLKLSYALSDAEKTQLFQERYLNLLQGPKAMDFDTYCGEFNVVVSKSIEIPGFNLGGTQWAHLFLNTIRPWQPKLAEMLTPYLASNPSVTWADFLNHARTWYGQIVTANKQVKRAAYNASFASIGDDKPEDHDHDQSQDKERCKICKLQGHKAPACYYAIESIRPEHWKPR